MTLKKRIGWSIAVLVAAAAMAFGVNLLLTVEWKAVTMVTCFFIGYMGGMVIVGICVCDEE